MKKGMLKLFGGSALCLTFGLQCSTAFAQVITFTNPTPAANDFFGGNMATLGTDRVLIGAALDDAGATDAGAVYLFNLNGTLLVTFTNPTPATGDWFGSAIAAVGNDRVLIGADYGDAGMTNAGGAYLFDTNGILLTTFAKPAAAHQDFFGHAVAAVGNGAVLIGAYGDDTGASGAGAAYLFNTNGTLLTTFTNPTPAAGDFFGDSVAALGKDRVLIGAYGDDVGALDSGAAYLFGTNGTLLATFTNPTPAAGDNFGHSLVAAGTDKILIGAFSDNTGADDAGAAYLFNTNGTLLMTFTNPAPAAQDFFGCSLAAVGADRVLIGAYGDSTGASHAGTAYLFNTDGTLLMTFTNPAPAANDFFAGSLAAGVNQAIIGAHANAMGANNVGIAYLFNLPTASLSPLLSITQNPALTTLTVSWPVAAGNWVLENTNSLTVGGIIAWPQISPPYQTNSVTISVTFTNVTATGSQFFRLHNQ